MTLAVSICFKASRGCDALETVRPDSRRNAARKPSNAGSSSTTTCVSLDACSAV